MKQPDLTKNRGASSMDDLHLIKRLLGYLKPHRKIMVFVYIFAVFNVASAIAIPLLIRYGIDKGINAADKNILLFCAGLLAITLLIQFFAFRWQGLLMMKTAHRVFAALRRDLYNHIQRLSFRFFDQHKAGNLMTRLTSDVQVLENLLAGGLDTIVVDIILLFGICTAMLLLDLRLSILLVIIIPLLSLFLFGLRPRIYRSARAIQKKLSSVNAFLNESLSGIMVSRAFAREEQNISFFHNVNDDYYRQTKKLYPLMAIFWQGISSLNVVSMALVLTGGGVLLYYKSITLGVIAAFMTYVNQLFMPMQKISNLLNQLNRALASCGRIFAVLDEKPEIIDQPDCRKKFRIKGEVKFKDVSFAYNPGEPVLKDINFTVNPGQTAAFVGATGSGKSTIINLLNRFYEVKEGQILIDGNDLRTLDRSVLRAQTGIVMQEPLLFSGTVLDNIRLGKPEADTAEVIATARELGIHEIIAALPHGYDTWLGEGGGNISIGQKQLLAFARAMLRNPSLLILDEASAYIDTTTEARVQKALEKLMQGRTSFVIAHRLATIRSADLIMVISNGKIIEQGSHNELLTANRAYASLLKDQNTSQT